MVLLLATLAFAETGGDTADTGDTAEAPAPRDTAPYEDTSAVAEEVYVEDVGCGGSAASVGILGVLGLLGLGGRRREG